MGRTLIRQTMAVFMAAVCAVVSPGAPARDESVTGDKGTDMAIDLILMRPLGLAGIVVGAGIFVISLPFTISAGTTRDAAKELLEKPMEYTFHRPLGDFDHCGADRHPCGE